MACQGFITDGADKSFLLRETFGMIIVFADPLIRAFNLLFTQVAYKMFRVIIIAVNFNEGAGNHSFAQMAHFGVLRGGGGGQQESEKQYGEKMFHNEACLFALIL
jgi:hypothetical protein